MDAQIGQTPDLASILRTLASYTPSHAYPPPQPIPAVPPAEAPVVKDLEGGEYDPEEYDPTRYEPSPSITSGPYPPTPTPQPPLEAQQRQQHQPQNIHSRPHLQSFDAHQYHQQQPTHQEPFPNQQPLPHQQAPPHQHPPPAPQPTSLPPPPFQKPTNPQLPHPSTITTWPPALRHITTLTTTSPTFHPRIRHLIETQHNHERQWYLSRVTLTQTLASRSEKKRKLDSVLNSIGGKVDAAGTTNALSTEKELEIFDKKVYRACKQMVASTTQELGKLEVPFFCTKVGSMGEEELGRLRGKMLELLEDLCGEEEGGK